LWAAAERLGALPEKEKGPGHVGFFERPGRGTIAFSLAGEMPLRYSCRVAHPERRLDLIPAIVALNLKAHGSAPTRQEATNMNRRTFAYDPLVLVDPEVQGEARRFVEEISQSGVKPLALALDASHTVVPESLSSVLLDIIAKLASDSAVGVVALPEELTTTIAAKHLGVSRPTLMKLIQRGDINSYKVGTHTRLNRSEVAEYVAARDGRRAAALEQLLQDGADYPN